MQFYNPSNTKFDEILNKAKDIQCSHGFDEVCLYLATLETYLDNDDDEWKDEFNEWLASKYHNALLDKFIKE